MIPSPVKIFCHGLRGLEVQRALSAVISTITEKRSLIKLGYLSMPTKTAPEGQHSRAHH